MKNEKGFTLIEVMIAIALLGIIVIAFLGALSTASKALFLADERATSESLARSEMEYIKKCDYEKGASPLYEHDYVSVTGYPGYEIKVDAPPIDPDTGTPLANPADDDGIQEITVTVKHHDKLEVIILEDYKVDR